MENRNMLRTMLLLAAFLLILVPSGIAGAGAASASDSASGLREGPSPYLGRALTLEECVEIALKNNRRRPASRFAVEIAEAQHQQALSAYWPQIGAKVAYTVLDQDPNFIFPASTIQTPAISGTVTTPLGPLPVNVPAQSINVPQQNVKLMEQSTLLMSANVQIPLYTGGLRSSLVRQAERGLEVAKQEVRRTDLEIVHDVRRMYYGAVLARELQRLGQEALDRLAVTLELTEKLYQAGSERVKKTDYLRNKTAVEGLRSATAFLQGNAELAKAALTNTLGIDWRQSIELAADGIPFHATPGDLATLVGDAYTFSPDWAKLEEGLKAAEAKIDEAFSGHLPKLAIVGMLNRFENASDTGMMTPENKTMWSIGAVMEVPLFDGFRTTAQVSEARARLARLREQQVLLREGIALQVRHVLIQMQSAAAQQRANGEAVRAAEENRDLNERAYQEELVETKDVIESQLIESFVKAQHLKSLYDHVEAQAGLDFVVGQEVTKRLVQPRP
jgi:outer membrane protein TolC